MSKIQLPIKQRYGGTSTVSVEHDGEYLTKQGKQRLADSIANSQWSTVQSRSTVEHTDSQLVKHTACVSHGGYVVVRNEPAEGFEERLTHDDFTVQGDITVPEFYVYTFEEDCAWSLLVQAATESTREKLEQDWQENAAADDPKPITQIAGEIADRYYSDRNPQPVF